MFYEAMMGTLRRSEERNKDEIRDWSAAEVGSGRVRLADGCGSGDGLITSTEIINNKLLFPAYCGIYNRDAFTINHVLVGHCREFLQLFSRIRDLNGNTAQIDYRFSYAIAIFI